MDYQQAPNELRSFLNYMSTIRGKSPRTCQEYFLDLRMFFRFMLRQRNLVPAQIPFDEISIEAIDLAFIGSITLTDVYDFLAYVSTSRPKYHKSSQSPMGNGASARARKVSALRAFYKYLTEKVHKLEINPIHSLESPKIKQSLPKHLSFNESIDLLEHIESDYPERDFCIITLFLNCGLRVSELVGINRTDVAEDTLRVLGKGNKERVVYLNEACQQALAAYAPQRAQMRPRPQDASALFISRLGRRISPQTVKWMVGKQLEKAGLGDKKYSAHKLRHTAATLMYQNGVDVRTLKEVLGHENLDTTMIYTHVTDENMKQAALHSPLAKVEPPKGRKPKQGQAKQSAEPEETEE